MEYFDYIILPTCSFAEFSELISPYLCAQTPIQEGFMRVRLSAEIKPTDNIIVALQGDEILPSGDKLGEFA
ncbi:MAG: hypothetical protein HGA87_01005 [Desulfobulbaceae bacterium]|nr:hypothetical protein [Desulfobulbaceae bacterium]